MTARQDNAKAFTLIELLVVIAILALLVSILLPSLNQARRLAKIVKAHAELRDITLAIAMYSQENAWQIPPTRFSCSSRTAYDLPVELLDYLPRGRSDGVDIVEMRDPFRAKETYKYRAPGPAIMNESTIMENAATLWVPDGFPDGEAETGRYYDDSKTSPVRYAVWSMGPDANSPKFDMPGRLPLPRKYWLRGPSDTGVIVHFADSEWSIRMSP